MTYHNAQKFILRAPDEYTEQPLGNNVKALWRELGNPQRGLKYIRLTGSNGKTVTEEMLISVYKGSAHKVGALTTTLRNDLRDNIHIDGSSLGYDELASYIETVYKTAHAIAKASGTELVLTKQEILLSAALIAFREAECEFCIIESDHAHADPTIFLPPPFSVAICGAIPSGSKKEIQMIRSYICHGIEEIISAPQDQESYKVISDTCVSVNCRLTIPAKAALEIKKISLSGSSFTYKDKQYDIGMCGKFQINNAIFAIELLDRLDKKGYGLSYEEIYEGLKNTRIPAKFEILSIMPTIIADSTHSDVAISAVCESMTDFRNLIGSKIRLCLPEGPIVDKYLNTLNEKGYQIQKIIISGNKDTEDSSLDAIYCKKPKELIRHLLENLNSDEILLISGPSTFTLQVRYALLSALGF